MAITDGYTQSEGGFYKNDDGSGPYSIASDGTISLIGSGGDGGSIPNPLPVSGPLTNAQLTAVTGTAAQTVVPSDPAASGLTVLALLRGILAEQKAQTMLLNEIATNTAPAGG